MLTRIYVDNYRCFVNFEYKPSRKQVILGRNGAGKSSLFEILGRLRDLVVTGVKVEEAFPLKARTRWSSLTKQTFEVEANITGSTYLYRLVLDVWGEPPRQRILVESLFHDANPIFDFSQGEVHLYNDRYDHKVTYDFDWFRPALATVYPRPDNRKLSAFKDWLAMIYCLKIDPLLMSERTEKEETHPNADLTNFAAWYRHLVQEDFQSTVRLHDRLRPVLEGFQSLELVKEGPSTRMLRVRFGFVGSPGSEGVERPIEVGFEELSDGQRALVCLYSLLQFAVRPGCVLCLDEPDNFVALEEIQPWLMALQDKIDEASGQVLIISQNPEIINILAPECGVVFFREDGPVRVEPFVPDKHLPPAEQVARGWANA